MEEAGLVAVPADLEEEASAVEGADLAEAELQGVGK